MNFQQRIEKMHMKSLARKTNIESSNVIEPYELIRIDSVRREEKKRHHDRVQSFLQSIPPIFRENTFDHFNTDYPEQRNIKNIAQRFVDTAIARLEAGTNLILHGGSGTGKTMLSLIMCQGLAKAGYDVRYESSLQFLRLFRDKNFESHAAFDNLLNYYTRTQFLVIDEVTESRVTGNHLTNWEKEMLFALIDARYQQQKRCTFIISNQIKEKLIERLGDRIFGRLSQHSILLAFNWNSYRQLKGDKSC